MDESGKLLLLITNTNSLPDDDQRRILGSWRNKLIFGLTEKIYYYVFLRMKLNPTLPRYEQVRLGLLEMLQSHYRPGDLLPTREEFAKRFGTSVITVKRALDELGREQMVRSVRGKGTIVTRPEVTDRRAHVSSWTDSVSGLGEQPQTGWLRIEEIVPEPTIRERLQMLVREKVVRLSRLRLVKGRAICLMTNYIPAVLASGMAQRGLSHESLYRDLHHNYGLHPARAEETVSVRGASREERTQLGKDVSAVLCIERLTRLADGQPMEWAEVIAHPGRYRYQVDLINTSE